MACAQNILPSRDLTQWPCRAYARCAVLVATGGWYLRPTSSARFIAVMPWSTVRSGVVLIDLTDPPAVAASEKAAASSAPGKSASRTRS